MIFFLQLHGCLDFGNAFGNNALQVRNGGRATVARLLQPLKLCSKFHEGLAKMPGNRAVDLCHWLPQGVMIVYGECARTRFSAASIWAMRRIKWSFDSNESVVRWPLQRFLTRRG